MPMTVNFALRPGTASSDERATVDGLAVITAIKAAGKTGERQDLSTRGADALEPKWVAAIERATD